MARSSGTVLQYKKKTKENNRGQEAAVAPPECLSATAILWFEKWSTTEHLSEGSKH